MHLILRKVIAAVARLADKVRVCNKRGAVNPVFSPILLLAVFGILSSMPSPAQTTSGTILGIVTDNTGAAVPGANVTLTNVDTQVKNTATSDDNGAYQFVNIPPGNYTVDIEKTGFAHQKRGPAALQVQGSLKIDATLQIGDVAQTGTVNITVPLVE